MGDAAGIGPEIIAAHYAQGLPTPAFVIGSVAAMRRAAALRGGTLDVTPIDPAQVSAWGTSPEARRRIGVVEVTDWDTPPPYGRISAACGQAAYAAIRRAIDFAKAGTIDAIVTAPIHKEALAAAAVPYPGHTEMLADHGGGGPVAMMLANDAIKVVLVTIHQALRDAILSADFEAQMRALRLAHEGGRAFGIKAPRVAVAGLNPHAGEGGLFGREEIEIIAPAIAQARREGIDASGPWPGDTVFMQARCGAFDVVVAQYHDQGLIPVKYMGLEEGVNITLGLPFVRTSPDHGTAFDIAGQGIAEAGSFASAVACAQRLVEARIPNRPSSRADLQPSMR
ncbi:MAG: 4-hydroxythreonine-4-phosphate dehydrogenase PdxA [Pseudomonadota bacterium]